MLKRREYKVEEKLNLSAVPNNQVLSNKFVKNIQDLTIPSFDYLFDSKYYSVREMYVFGSRKSAKTKHLALRIILRTMVDKDYNALAMRKIASEIKQSIQAELQWAINTLGVSHLWNLKIADREYIYTPTGQKVIMKGISINPSSGKPSLSGLNVTIGTIKDCWLEEAWEFIEADYNMIRQTLRGGSYTMFMIGNPYFASIWCVRKAVNLLPPELEILIEKGQMWKYFPKAKGKLETIVHWNNFQINTKLHEADIEERWAEKDTNPKDFITTGYGMVGSPSGSILGDLTDNIQYISFEEFERSITETTAGVDVGLTNDATACVFGGWDHNYNWTGAGEYYHSNGDKECNQFSNNGIWKKKNPQELAQDVIDFYLMYEPIWSKFKKVFKVNVDSADRAFISILNTKVKQIGYTTLIKFVPTIGKEKGKKRIESRIIWERQMLSHSKIKFVEIDSINTMKQLHYEMENLPWKLNMSNGRAVMIRDDSKVPDHIINAFEYAIRDRMNRATKNI